MLFTGRLWQLVDSRVVDMQTETASTEFDLDELLLTRNILLAHPLAGKVAPADVIGHVRRYSSVTHWEELVCAVINTKAAQLMGIVSIRQPDGYSGIFRRHGSIEYVRFFIDWGEYTGFQSAGVAHFKVFDSAAKGADTSRFPLYHLVATDFDIDRYWESVLSGMQPKVRAVLSWNQLPESDVAFTPVFGNQVDSRICIDSDKILMNLFEHPKQHVGCAKYVPNYGNVC